MLIYIMSKFYATHSKNYHEMFNTKSRANGVKKTMHRCTIILKYKSFYSRNNASRFAASGNSITENKALFEEVLTLHSERFEYFNIPIAHTDGACSKKGSAAYAGAGIYLGPHHPLNETEFV